MKSITVLHEDNAISFIADITDKELDGYIKRLERIVRSGSHFIVAEAECLNRIIASHPKVFQGRDGQEG
ncbi:MAG: hypothetical protein ACXAC5_11810 [Promethearchaeota archaeon]|jgi:hypothetical protein